jgi:hypothetical protein
MISSQSKDYCLILRPESDGHAARILPTTNSIAISGFHSNGEQQLAAVLSSVVRRQLHPQLRRAI